MLAAVVVTLLLWASAFVAIRHLGRDVPPGALSLGRLLVASVALALEERGALGLSIATGDALARGVVAAGALATLLIGIRFVWMPDPAEFLSRQIGLYLAGASAIGATLAGLAQVATRE